MKVVVRILFILISIYLIQSQDISIENQSEIIDENTLNQDNYIDILENDIKNNNINKYTKKLTYKTFKQWKKLNLIEKLEYLIDYRDLYLLYREYINILTVTSSKQMNYQCVYQFLNEFKSNNHINDFYKECDQDNNNNITFTEYVICRGEFDNFGNLNDVNEYAFRENGLIQDFEMLLSSGKKMTDIYEYDENGMIIGDY